MTSFLSQLHRGALLQQLQCDATRTLSSASRYAIADLYVVPQGADLAHVICESAPGNVIKTYSPDLIVHGSLDKPSSPEAKKAVEEEIDGLLERLHSIVIGPGLGRDQHMQDWAEFTVRKAREKNAFIVLDADGLWLIQNKP